MRVAKGGKGLSGRTRSVGRAGKRLTVPVCVKNFTYVALTGALNVKLGVLEVSPQSYASAAVSEASYALLGFWTLFHGFGGPFT